MQSGTATVVPPTVTPTKIVAATLTSTATATEAAPATATPTVTATEAAPATATSTHTATPVLPSATPTNTPDCAIKCTYLTPTATRTLALTNTPKPPTATPTVTPTLAPQGAQITIVKDALPNASRNFAFNGDLGAFKLDDPTTDDGDPYANQRTFNVLPGSFTVYEKLSDGWTLNDIVCSPAANATVNLVEQSVAISVASGDQVTCTFVNDAPTTGAINAMKYYDANCNGRYEPTVDHWLAGWTMTVYTPAMSPVASGETDSAGQVSFPTLAPGDYVVCETPKAGWTNSQPSIFGYAAPGLDHPCYTVEVDAGKLAVVKFGNFDFDAVTAASAEVGAEGVAHFDLLSDADQRLYEEGLSESTFRYKLFIPFINQ